MNQSLISKPTTQLVKQLNSKWTNLLINQSKQLIYRTFDLQINHSTHKSNHQSIKSLIHYQIKHSNNHSMNTNHTIDHKVNFWSSIHLNIQSSWLQIIHHIPYTNTLTGWPLKNNIHSCKEYQLIKIDNSMKT